MSGGHEALAHALRRHQQTAIVQPEADVAVVRRRVAARIQAAARPRRSPRAARVHHHFARWGPLPFPISLRARGRLRRLPSGARLPELHLVGAAAVLGAEEPRVGAGAAAQRPRRHDERAADGIAHQRHGGGRLVLRQTHAFRRSPRHSRMTARTTKIIRRSLIVQPSHRASPRIPEPFGVALGTRAPTSGCADSTPSSACRAARASSDAGRDGRALSARPRPRP